MGWKRIVGRLLVRLPHVAVLVWATGSCTKNPNPYVDASPGARPPIWRFAIEETLGSVQHVYALRFKELIEKRSGGEIQVIVYPYGPLGTSDQLTELCHMGSLEFVTASPGHLGKVIPEVQVFLLHFVFSDNAKTNQIGLNENPRLRKSLDALYRQKGFHLLSVFSEGWQVWTTKKRVRQPADFRGIKMRVMTTPLLLAAYAAYGASPTPMPYSEVYSALQLNMIDGQENPVFAIEEMSFYEVTDWMIFPYHAPFVTTVMTNHDFFENLAPDRKKLVLDAVDELNEYILRTSEIYNRERLKTIVEKESDLNLIGDFTDAEKKELLQINPNLNIEPALTDKERSKFREASKPVRKKFIRLAPEGGEILDRLRQAVQRAEISVREPPREKNHSMADHKTQAGLKEKGEVDGVSF